MSSLIERLRAKDKKGYYDSSTTTIFYPTGFTTLDYRNSSLFKIYNENDEIVNSYTQLGVQDGSINTLVSETGVGKTTLICAMAYNIVKPFDNGMVMHMDIEETFSLGRAKDITGMPRKDINSKYILIQEKLYINDILTRIKEIHDTKIEYKKEYEYDTGCVDERGKKIIKFVPTVIIIDSLKVMQMDADKIGEMEGATSNQRKAQSITMFMEKITPICKAANIIVLIINHLKTKIEMNMFSKTKAQLTFMSNKNKTIPGGDAALYLSSNVWYIDNCGKYTIEENGFSGSKCKLWLWKTRSNFAGTNCPMVFNQQFGFDDTMAMYNVLLDNELIGGRNPKRYILGSPEVTFDDRKLYEEMQTRPELRDAIKERAIDVMKEWTSSKSSKNDDEDEDEENDREE